MTKLRRDEFLERFAERAITVADAQRAHPRLTGADENGDGEIAGPREWLNVFSTLDAYDRDRNALRLDLGTAARPSAVGRALARIEQRTRVVPRSPLSDFALLRAFPNGLAQPLRSGARGEQVTAVQYALLRTGDLHALIDRAFGRQTEAAVRAFQERATLPVTGEVDAATLAALDRAVYGLPLPPDDPMAVLSQFDGLTPIAAPDPARGRIDWNHPDVQAAYRQFVPEYWPHMRAHRVECDCKTVGLFFMSQFRRYFAEQTGVTLPMPSSADGRAAIRDSSWTTITTAMPRGYFQRVDRMEVPPRRGYDSVALVEALDPSHSMIYGINLRYQGTYADDVYRVAHLQQTGVDNGGDTAVPEIDVNALEIGDMIFMNHNRQRDGVTTPDRRIDHAMTVVGLERDEEGRVRKLVLAIGSFDDVTDADSTTPPAGPAEINLYVEELTVSFDEAGRIEGSRTTYSSEPDALIHPRYSAKNTLMELNAGGSMFVGRWGTGRRRR